MLSRPPPTSAPSSFHCPVAVRYTLNVFECDDYSCEASHEKDIYDKIPETASLARETKRDQASGGRTQAHWTPTAAVMPYADSGRRRHCTLAVLAQATSALSVLSTFPETICAILHAHPTVIFAVNFALPFIIPHGHSSVIDAVINFTRRFPLRSDNHTLKQASVHILHSVEQS